MVHRRKDTYLLVAFLTLLLGCPTLLHASTYNYGEQGQNFGGPGSDVLNPPRFAGPHALLSVDDEEHFYNQNGDLVRVDSNDPLQNTQNTYTVTRKLKKVNQGGAITRFFITATGEKVATIHPDGRKETTPSGHLQFTNDRPRYQYGGDIRTSENGSNLWVSIQDHIGSIVATVDSTMLLEKIDRHPFGGIAYHTMGDMHGGYNDRGFHGYEEEGPYTYFPARHLNKNHGRFIQADSVIPHGDVHGHNRYGYTRGNPVNYVDPSGHDDVGIGFEDEFEESFAMDDPAADYVRQLTIGAATLGLGLTFIGDANDFGVAATGYDTLNDERVTGLWRYAGLAPIVGSGVRKTGNVVESILHTFRRFQVPAIDRQAFDLLHRFDIDGLYPVEKLRYLDFGKRYAVHWDPVKLYNHWEDPKYARRWQRMGIASLEDLRGYAQNLAISNADNVISFEEYTGEVHRVLKMNVDTGVMVKMEGLTEDSMEIMTVFPVDATVSPVDRFIRSYYERAVGRLMD